MPAKLAVVLCLLVCCGKSGGDSTSIGAESKAGTSAHGATGSRAIIEIPSTLAPSDRVAATQARDALLAACANMLRDRNEFREISIATGHAGGYLKDRFDWDLMVTVTLVYKEGLDRRRGGQRVTFEMGAGNRPGIITRKAQGIELCGFSGRAHGVSTAKPCDPDGTEDCILDVDALKVLDAERPPSVVESHQTSPAAWCFGFGFDPPPFWTCAATQNACKRARAAEKRDENEEYKVRTECKRTESLYCFAAESGRTLCAPDAATCAASRKEWTNSGTATPCEVGTSTNLEASNRRDQ